MSADTVPEPLVQTQAQVEGLHIADLRTEKHLSQRHLAAMFGITQTKLNEAENGRLSLEETQALHRRVREL